MKKQSEKISISKKPFMNLQDTQAVIDYWTQNNDGHFNLQLYEKFLKQKEQSASKSLTK